MNKEGRSDEEFGFQADHKILLNFTKWVRNATMFTVNRWVEKIFLQLPPAV